MAKNRQRLFAYLALSLLPLLLTQCAWPKIIVLPDPLSAAEHNDLGVIYEQKGLAEAAEKEYLKAIKKAPDWATPYFNLGNIYYARGQHKQAEKSYRRALKCDGDYAAALNNLGCLLYDQGQYPEAKFLVEKALRLDPRAEYQDTYLKILARETIDHTE